MDICQILDICIYIYVYVCYKRIIEKITAIYIYICLSLIDIHSIYATTYCVVAELIVLDCAGWNFHA